MKTYKTFGLSVLISGMARKLRPVVREETRLRKLDAKMEAQHVDPTIAKNVLEWQKRNHRRLA